MFFLETSSPPEMMWNPRQKLVKICKGKGVYLLLDFLSLEIFGHIKFQFQCPNFLCVIDKTMKRIPNAQLVITAKGSPKNMRAYNQKTYTWLTA